MSLLVLALAGLSGCATTPMGYANLTGSRSLDISGKYPSRVEFDRGLFAETDGVGSVVLAGPRAVLFLDYGGHGNRFELLIGEESQTVLYRRVGQRTVMSGDGRSIGPPTGMHVSTQRSGLVGEFGVVADRVDLDGFGTKFEHYPKQMRVTGRFVMSRANASSDPAARASAFWRPVDSESAANRPLGMGDVDARWIVETFAPSLPSLLGAD